MARAQPELPSPAPPPTGVRRRKDVLPEMRATSPYRYIALLPRYGRKPDTWPGDIVQRWENYRDDREEIRERSFGLYDQIFSGYVTLSAWHPGGAVERLAPEG